jgi:hypothetical protein
MFNFVDIIDAMLDPNCLLVAKIRLGLFLFNAVVDVETMLPAFKVRLLWSFSNGSSGSSDCGCVCESC